MRAFVKLKSSRKECRSSDKILKHNIEYSTEVDLACSHFVADTMKLLCF